jgi:hypothetical protein
MFFFEILAFIIVWPLVWWLGGLDRDDRRGATPRPPDPPEGAKVVDLHAWRIRRARKDAAPSRRRIP